MFPHLKINRWAKWGIRLLPVVGLTLWVLLTNPLNEMATQLRDCPLWPFLLAVLINFFGCLLIRSLRWRFSMGNPPSLKSVYAAMLEGLAANTVLGLGMFDVVRSVRLKSASHPLSATFGSALADRFSDTVAIMVIILVMVVLEEIPTAWVAFPIGFSVLWGVVSLKLNTILGWLNSSPRLHRIASQLRRSLMPKRTV